MLGRNLVQAAAGNAAEAETAWDIDNAVFDGNGRNFLGIIEQEQNLTGGTFKTDGTKMYIIGGASVRYVSEFNLSTAWDITTASYVQNFSTQSDDIAPEGLHFKPDGTKMYIAGAGSDEVNEYSLSTAWDISTLSYVQNFSLSSEGTSPTGIYIKSDGSKMYISDSNGDEINEYDLSTAWDVSTASYNQNFSVSGQDLRPEGVFFRDDGSSDAGKKMWVVGDYGDDIIEYTLTTAWDISTASYARQFYVFNQETQPHGVHFKSDGSKMFVFGQNTRAVYQYTLSTSWQLPGSYSHPTTDRKLLSSEDSNPTGVFFKGDGSKMFICGRGGDEVNEYTLSTAWEIHTATYSQNFSISSQEGNSRGMFFRNDGTSEDGKQMYIIGTSGDSVFEYSLTTAWDISTASYNQSFSVSTQSTSPYSVVFKSDGSKMYILDGSVRKIFRYDLSTDWDVSSASYDGSTYDLEVTSEEVSPRGMYLKDDGTRLYVVGVSGDDINQYNLSTAWDVASATHDTTFHIGYTGYTPSGLFFKPDGTKFFVNDTGSDSMHAFTIS